MRELEYYVASSIDGFICGPDEDVSGFVPGGNGIEKYLNDLKAYDTVIMGRKTYEFGFKYGLVPGKAAYSKMENHVFTSKTSWPSTDDKLKFNLPRIDIVKDILAGHGSPVYLCGGGQMAGWLLEHRLITKLILKLNPFIQGEGTRLFGDSKIAVQLKLISQAKYEHDLQIINYQIKY